MKKQNGKKAAANDVEKETPKAKKSKRVPDDARYVVGNLATVKRGFLLEMVTFAKAKGEVDHAMLVKEFGGRQIDGHKVDAARITRYLAYSRNHGILKVAK